MPIWKRTIRGTEYLYYKIPSNGEYCIGKKDEVLNLYKILRSSSANQKIVLKMLQILERENLYRFFNTTFGNLKKELKEVE